MAPLTAWRQSIRVRHWIKNFFVLIPFLMGKKFGFNDPLLRAVAGTLIFCALSSATYLFNDIVDRKSDVLHPKKRFRPIAAGEITVPSAASASLLLAIVSLSCALLLDRRFLVVLLLYVVNNVLYSFFLKEKTVLDVMSIAVGFVLRVYAGGFIVGIEITKWLVACVFALSLFIGFGKRRSEYEDLKTEATRIRKVHESYSVQKLDLLLGTSAAFTIVTYMLYSLAPETKALHGTDNIIFTTPLVVYCIYRFMLKVQEERHGDPVEVMMKDRGFLVAGTMWLVSILAIIH